MVHGMHLPWVACSNDLERAFMTLWRWAGSKFKIHTEVHFSLSIWKVPASNVKRWSEEEKAISLKGMSWCAAKPVVDPSHCSAAAAQISTSIRTFPKYRSSRPKRTTVIILTQSVSVLIIKVWWESLFWACFSSLSKPSIWLSLRWHPFGPSYWVWFENIVASLVTRCHLQ